MKDNVSEYTWLIFLRGVELEWTKIILLVFAAASTGDKPVLKRDP